MNKWAAGLWGLVGVLGAIIASPGAQAAPGPCTASAVATTASGVLGQAGGYLDSHPDVNDVLTNAVQQDPADARATVRGYFAGHLGELTDLQRIVAPLTNLRNQCGVSVSPGQLAALFEALSG